MDTFQVMVVRRGYPPMKKIFSADLHELRHEKIKIKKFRKWGNFVLTLPPCLENSKLFFFRMNPSLTDAIRSSCYQRPLPQFVDIQRRPNILGQVGQKFGENVQNCSISSYCYQRHSENFIKFLNIFLNYQSQFVRWWTQVHWVWLWCLMTWSL